MRKIIFCSFVIGVVFTVVLIQPVSAQENRTCRVAFKSPPSPKRGDTVEITGDLHGTATVSPGMFLWVFVHRQGHKIVLESVSIPAGPEGRDYISER